MLKTMQAELPLKFNNCDCGCIFNHFEIPDNNQWAHDLKKERRKKISEDLKWVFDLIDKYSND